MSIINRTPEAGVAASAGFQTTVNVPEGWSTDWARYSPRKDLVAWTNDAYFGRKWEMNHIFKVPGGPPRPIMFNREYLLMFLEMNGAYHYFSDENRVYSRIEGNSPLMDIIADLRNHRAVRWEVGPLHGGDLDVQGERLFLSTIYSHFK
jgi:hypothetical protein